MSKHISRRNFFKRAAAFSTAGLAGPLLSSLPVRAADGKSSVVLAKDTQCMNGTTPVQAKVNDMVDHAIMNLTGITDRGLAYEALFPETVTASTTIAIKKNYRSGFRASTDAVVTALKNGLSTMRGGTFPAGNVKDYSGARATSASSQRFTLKQWSWQSKTYVDRDFVIGDEFTKEDWLINVPVAWGHNLAGTTLSLKNHLGTVRGENGTGISNLHGFYDEVHPSLAVLNSQPYFKDKQVLVMTDAICCRSDGGPGGLPNVTCHTVIAGADRVAADYQGTQLLARNGLTSAALDKALEWLALCGQAKWELGTDDPANMDVINITPPWTTGIRAAGQVSPNGKPMVQVRTDPSFKTVTFGFKGQPLRTGNVSIFNMSGKEVWSGRSMNNNALTWPGTDHTNQRVRTGTYAWIFKSDEYQARGRIKIIK
jgi:hypothetical protein